MLQEGDILSGKYRILTEIGKGGMSKVWLSIDTALNKQWAVKEINKSTHEYKVSVDENQTLREIEIMKGLDHPLLPRIVDIIDGPESLCVVMDYIEGITLQKVMKMQGPPAQEVVAAWMLDICEVLDYLHNLSPPIIYRDLKPANIMLRPDGTIRIIDFGIAREYREGFDDTVCLGTKGYASPEHFEGKTTVRSDIYTAGVTMYYLLTGRNPAEPPYEVVPIRQVNPALSSGLEAIILKATEADPQKRYQSAAQMRSAIASYKKLEEPYIRKLKKKMRISRLLTLSGIGLVLAGAVFYGSSVMIDNNTYEDLVSRENPDISIRQEELGRAISLKPERKDAYIRLIDAYASDGFTENEASEFLAIYNGNKAKIEKESKAYAELNFEIGQAFLLHYSGSSDGSNRHRLMTAEPFFAEAQSEDFDRAPLAKGYCDLAVFMKEYIIGGSDLVGKEATKEEYDKVLTTMQGISENLNTYEGDGKNQLMLVSSELMMSVIETSRQGFCRAEVAEDTLLSQVERIIKDAGNVNAESERLEEKKEAVLNQADTLKKRIHTTYVNDKKKEKG